MPDGTYYPGTFATDGTYYIPELSPAGPYVLWFHDSSGVLLLLDTTSLDVDLGYDQLGRCSSMIATAGTATLFQLAQLDPWNTTSSELQAASSGANTWRSIASGAQLLAGSTTASLLESWTDALLVPTDVLWLHQLSPQWHPSGFPYRASVRAAQVSQVLLPGGATTTVAAVLWPVPQSGAVSVNWTPSLFESSLGDMAPPARVASGIVPAHRLAVTASPFAARYPAPAPSAGSLQLATMDFPAGAGAVSLGSPLPYGRFLPSDWSEWREVRYAVAVGYQAPGATDVIYQISSVGQREAIPAPAGIAPALTPVRSPLINGSSALADQTVAVTGAPTFSWSPPATGTPSVYTLEIFSLQAAAGHSTAQLVLRYLTQSTSVTLPGGLLLSGGVYFARISALASDVPYLSAPLRYSPLLAEATALTGTFSP